MNVQGRSRFARLKSGLQHAFAVERPEDIELTDEQSRLLDRLAKKIVDWGLTAPAMVFIESFKPLNYVGSQFLAFFEPLIRGMFDWREYTIFYQTFEKRGSVEVLLDRIDFFESEKQERNKQKKIDKAKEKSQKRAARKASRGDHG